jgi:WD40-like Beta Propeller Repeat
MGSRTLVGGRAWIVVTGCVLLVAIAAVPSPAVAAFPGANGEIAFTYHDIDGDTIQVCTSAGGGPYQFGCLTQVHRWAQDPAYSGDGQRIVYWEEIVGEIYTMNPDHLNSERVRSNVWEAYPSWSPTAIGKIVYAAGGLRTINAGGTDDAPLTADASDISPDWSPDGSKIAFTRLTAGNREIWVVSPGTGQAVQLTNTAVHELSPDFSPDGSKIIFSALGQLHTINADGTNRTPLPIAGETPSWSPDGQKVTYERADEIYFANLDGTGETMVPSPGGALPGSREPDWRPLPANTPSGFARPQGATPLRVSLVPAAEPCTAPNRQHGPPLAFPSCNPPDPASPNLTVGVGDGSFAFARSIGFVRFSVVTGIPTGPPDDADVNIRFSLSNVMRTSDLSEYTGELRGRVEVQLTDRFPSGGVPQTTQQFPISFDVPCVPTGAEVDKSLCELATTLDTLVPGAAVEATRAMFALDQVKVYDGGPDGDADTTADNSLFAVQGVFVP